MKCPNCNEVLVMTERQGIEIDYCPKCRGVWLDKGELDKIIERASGDPSLADQKQYEERKFKKDDDYDRDEDYRRRGNEKYPPYKRKGGFLGNLFDFD